MRRGAVRIRCGGSSPRVRGTLRGGAAPGPPRRFIPACTGNARAPSRYRAASPVHPRVCGERDIATGLSNCCRGSSPRVRGTPRRAKYRPHPSRFIPACAGNAPAMVYWPNCKAVHPRVCGERIDLGAQAGVITGSSPRVRGTRATADVRSPSARFIPACAGNANPIFRYHCAIPVHPRVCGERFPAAAQTRSRTGSSPRVRGTLHNPPTHPHLKRFIPACAGNAGEADCPQHCGSVHPRVCGERNLSRSLPTPAAGSSPRVRGTPLVCGLGNGGNRFIPACAGNAARG